MLSTVFAPKTTACGYRIMNHFSIKDVESLTGIKPHTLRIWEQRYGIPLPQRTATNIRYYSDQDIKYLLNVAMLNRQGYKISKIAKMSKEEAENIILEMTSNTSDQSIYIDSLIKAMFALNEEQFDQTLSANISSVGIEETFKQVIFPFLHRIGILWQAGSVNPSYEHFITHLIRQKLFVAMDEQKKVSHKDTSKFILFLPPHETHDIGLLFANYLIRARGFHTSYLGPNLPMNDISSVMSIYKADYILTVLTTAITAQTPLQIAHKLTADFPTTKILIAGSQVPHTHINFPAKVKLLFSLNDLVYLLDQLKLNQEH